jgi:hypothetical protein
MKKNAEVEVSPKPDDPSLGSGVHRTGREIHPERLSAARIVGSWAFDQLRV